MMRRIAGGGSVKLRRSANSLAWWKPVGDIII